MTQSGSTAPPPPAARIRSPSTTAVQNTPIDEVGPAETPSAPYMLRKEDRILNGLAELAIDAHGGLDRWRQYRTVSADLVNGGALWPLKGQAGVLDKSTVTVGLKDQWASHHPFGAPNYKSRFEPHRVAIEADDGEVIDELNDPRASFAGHQVDTPWNRLQLAYFAGYAMWTYLNLPFALARPDVCSEELSQWAEEGERWRRLKVTFPETIATHSKEQTLYFDQEGLLKRHDYDVDISGGSAAVHYVSQYRTFSGLMFPTRRRVFPRKPDGKAMAEPLLVSIELRNIVLS